LLVLDIDYTLYDHKSTAQNISILTRPFLHQFLTTVYERYDIVIWSATNMKWVDLKMQEMQVYSNPNFKIAFSLSRKSMISVERRDKEKKETEVVDIKPLAVIWAKYNQYHEENTIMLDDIRRNFLMNPKNGLKIRPFKNAHTSRESDDELIRISEYLMLICEMGSFADLNHKHWEKFVEKNKRGNILE